mgnify:FL=1
MDEVVTSINVFNNMEHQIALYLCSTLVVRVKARVVIINKWQDKIAS